MTLKTSGTPITRVTYFVYCPVPAWGYNIHEEHNEMTEHSLSLPHVLHFYLTSPRLQTKPASSIPGPFDFHHPVLSPLPPSSVVRFSQKPPHSSDLHMLPLRLLDAHRLQSWEFRWTLMDCRAAEPQRRCLVSDIASTLPSCYSDGCRMPSWWRLAVGLRSGANFPSSIVSLSRSVTSDWNLRDGFWVAFGLPGCDRMGVSHRLKQ